MVSRLFGFGCYSQSVCSGVSLVGVITYEESHSSPLSLLRVLHRACLSRTPPTSRGWCSTLLITCMSCSYALRLLSSLAGYSLRVAFGSLLCLGCRSLPSCAAYAVSGCAWLQVLVERHSLLRPCAGLGSSPIVQPGLAGLTCLPLLLRRVLVVKEVVSQRHNTSGSRMVSASLFSKPIRGGLRARAQPTCSLGKLLQASSP
jgi:hypothetical protein